MTRAADVALRRRFWRLTGINILANLTVPLAGLVDTALLGHLDDIRFLAGVALASVVFDYVYWSFGFLRMGTTGITAQAVGRGDDAEVARVLIRGFLLAGVIAVGLLALRVPIRELGFGLLGGEPAVEAAGARYFDARILGAPAALANFVLIGWFLGREESRRALWMTVVGNGANVVLDYAFIVRFGLAARGAGLATMLAQYLMLAAGLALCRGVSWQGALDRGGLVRRDRLWELFRLNRDILFRTLCLVSTFAIFTNLSALLGTVLLAVNAILLRLLAVASYLIDGAAFATESLAGILHGGGDPGRLRRLLGMALASGLLFAVAFLAVLGVGAGPFIGLLTSHEAVAAGARLYGGWLVPVLLFGSAAYILDGLFLGLTAGTALRNSMLLSTVAVFLPLAAAAVRLESNHLLWAAMLAFMVARASSLGLMAHIRLAQGRARGVR